MRLYVLAKMFALLWLLGVYVLFTLVIVGAELNEGWIVVMTRCYNEGTVEAVVLLAALPLLVYIVYTELRAAIACSSGRARES